MSNKAANVLKQYGDVEKGDRVFIFMPRSPELYFAVLGAIKNGAIVVHYLKHLWKVLSMIDLEDSEAKVIVTTPELIRHVFLLMKFLI